MIGIYKRADRYSYISEIIMLLYRSIYINSYVRTVFTH